MTRPLAILALLLVLLAGALLWLSGRRNWRPTLAAALLVALVFRVGMLVVAHDVAPYDLLHDFRIAGENVLQHQDPTLNSRPRGWSYLPTYGFLLAGTVGLEHATGLPWLWLARIVPIAADLGVVVLVYRLAGREKGGQRAFQYACTPITVFVSAVHGQMEPLCLLFALGAFLALRSSGSRRVFVAGVLIGLAISVKTWPVLFLPALLLGLRTWGDRARLLLSAAAVGLILIVTMPLTVATPIRELPTVVRAVAGYRPAGGTWGWSSVVFLVRPYTYESFETSTFWAGVGVVGTVATLVAVAVAVWWWRKEDPLLVAGVSASVFQVATAGHGAQYLDWPVPFTTLRPTPLQPLLQFAIGLWAWFGYVVIGGGLLPASWAGWAPQAWQVSSLALVLLIVLALPWQQRRAPATNPPAPAHAAV
jgi:hypothetical protein